MTNLSILPDGEPEQPLDIWRVFQADDRDQLLVHELLSILAGRTPDAIALVYNDYHFSYAEVERWSNQVARVLQAYGVGPECLVAVSLERSPELLITLLGILKAGGAYLPLDPTYPAERLAYMVRDSRVRLLLTWDALRGRFPAGLEMLSLEHLEQIGGQQPEVAPVTRVSKENLAYVIYTSGSTGYPKGVQVTHRGLRNLIEAQRHAFGVRPDHRVLQFASINFDASVSEVFVTLLSGATLCLGSREQLLPGTPLTTLLQEQAISMVTLPPSALAVLDAAKLPGIDTLIVAGEACPLDVARQWAQGRSFINAYGPTEYTVCATTGRYEEGSSVLSLGHPIIKTEVYILDEQQRLVPPGMSGELYLSGAGLARGYLGRPDLTAERFLPDAFGREPGARLYRTGDRARVLSNGTLEFLGRIDQQIKLRGYRIELGEIEQALRDQQGIRETIVMLREDTPGYQQLVAYMVEDKSQQLKISSLRSALKQRLPDYMLPAAFVVLEALPLLENGKLNRHALPAPDSERPDVSTPFIPPRTELERDIAQIWCEVLGLTRVGIADNFLELGGHSLRATLVQSGISEKFKVDLPLDCIFALPTIAELARVVAEHIHGGNQQESPLLLPVARNGHLPLSFAQERVWFVHQLNPANLAYNAQAVIRLHGNLHLPALRQALTEIVSRHEIFRTIFPTVDGQPVQSIQEPWQVTLPLRDLRTFPEAEREAAAGRIILEEGRWRFDLTRLPLVRWTLLQLQESEYMLCYVEHHLVHDGWSFTVFLRDLQDLYIAFCANKPSPLPALPLQFADFAYRQRQWLREDVESAEIQRTYWKKKLANLPEALQLPFDHPRPPVPSFRGTAFRISLPPALAQELRLLSRREGVTLYMLLFAAFNTLLYRYSGQENIPVGSSVANRRWKGTNHLIGMVLNSIVLCTHLTGELSFQELLQQVRTEALETYLHQDLPFDKVVEAVRPVRDLSYNPLFQVAFNFHDSPMPDLHFPGLTLDIQEALNNGSAKFDLSVTAIPRAEQQSGSQKEKEQSITLVWEYSTDLFEATTIARMIEHFQNLLESIVANPLATLSELPMLTPAEQASLLAQCAGPSIQWPDERWTPELISLQAARTPDAIALVYKEHHLSYEEVERSSNQLAHVLQQRGIGLQSLVGVALERSPELLIALLAVLKTGAAYVPLDPAYPPDRLTYMLQDSDASLLLTQSSLQSRFASSLPILCLDQEWAMLTRQSPVYPQRELHGEQLAYIIYTSGSTGRPKGVQVTHRSLANLLLMMSQSPGISVRDRLLAVTTLSFDIAELELYLPLIVGAQVVLADREIVADGVQLATQIQAEEITIMQATPATWRLLIETGWTGKAGLKIFCGGEALSRDLARQMVARSAEVWNIYGPTETTIYSTGGQIYATTETITIGRPLTNTQAYILDRSLNPVPVGVAGELYLGGRGVARGYRNQPELTAERFLPDPFSQEPGARLYRTGDLVRYLADGTLEYLGRIDHQVKVRGFRIELGEIEGVLRSQTGVREAVVILREDNPGNQRLVAYLGLEMNGSLEASFLRDVLKQHLPDYMIPAAFVFLDSLPRLANGKLDRRSLPAPDQARPDLSAPFVVPRTALEQMLVQIWSNVLGIFQVGTHDNFFDLGGHSLLLPQVYSRLRAAGVKGFTVVDLFQYPTIKALAERLERKDDQEMPETFALPHRARAALRRDALKKQSGFRQQRKPLPELETIPE